MVKLIVTNQDEFDALLQGIDQLDYFEEYIIELKGASFTLDGSKARFDEGRHIVLKGLGIEKTSLVLTTFPKESRYFDSSDGEVATWSIGLNLAVSSVLVTAKEMTQVSFGLRDDFELWEDVGFDTSLVAPVIVQDLVEDFQAFLKEIDVEGVVEIGDHLVVGRGLYTHHGVYVGRNGVIHYASTGVERTTLKDFCRSDTFWVYEHEERLSQNQTVKRAESRLGEDKYNLLTNNCEHFAWWCCTGEDWSHQVFGGLVLGNLANQANFTKHRLER